MHVQLAQTRIGLLFIFWKLPDDHNGLAFYKPSAIFIQRISLYTGLLTDTYNFGLRIRQECGERFRRHQLEINSTVSDPSMNRGTRVTHVLWCMSVSLIRGGGETFLAFPAHAQSVIFLVSSERPMWWIEAHIRETLGSPVSNNGVFFLRAEGLHAKISYNFPLVAIFFSEQRVYMQKVHTISPSWLSCS